MEAGEYSYPDGKFIGSETPGRDFLIWLPEETAVILGASNKPETSVNLPAAEEDDIPIIKRPSGGEAVVISPKTLGITMTEYPVELPGIKRHFRRFNQIIISGLTEAGIDGVEHRGISDLAINDIKVLGSSLYHSRKRLMYHGVLNVAEDPALIDRYLLHPQREPDYRQGRSHSEFITSLRQEGYDISISVLQRVLVETLKNWKL